MEIDNGIIGNKHSSVITKSKQELWFVTKLN